MAAINHFCNALCNTCGMMQAAANAIISQGFKDPASLILMEEDDIDLLVKHTLKAQVVPAEGVLIMIPYNAVIKLKAFHYFAVLSKRIGQPACSQDFTVEMLEFIQEVRKECHDHKNVADESPMKPRALKSLGEWHTWWEKFDGYLSQTTGAVEISLNYIY